MAEIGGVVGLWLGDRVLDFSTVFGASVIIWELQRRRKKRKEQSTEDSIRSKRGLACDNY